MRYPEHDNFIVMQVIPAGPDRTLGTYDFFFETAQPTAAQLEAIRYIDEVLQAEDIALVESVQRGMATPGFTQRRIVYDEGGSDRSEHAVHHLHGLILDDYAHAGR
jgi:choline monooxygenase